ALAAGAHTDFVVDKLRITDTPVVKIPMTVLNPESQDALNLYPGKLVIASFGLVTPEKRIEPVLQSLAELRWHFPDLKYVIVGEVARYYDLQKEIDSYGLMEMVEVTGRVEPSRFHEWMARADIVVNLRYPSAREMSATLLRALDYGKPVIISRLQHLLEI